MDTDTNTHMDNIDTDIAEEVRPPDEPRTMRLVDDDDYSNYMNNVRENWNRRSSVNNIRHRHPLRNSSNNVFGKGDPFMMADSDLEMAIQASLANEENEMENIIKISKMEYEQERMENKRTRFVSLKPKIEKLSKFDKQNTTIYNEILDYITLYETDIDIDFVYVSRENYETIMEIMKQIRVDMYTMEYMMELIRPIE
jgi:hypothetical protein